MDCPDCKKLTDEELLAEKNHQKAEHDHAAFAGRHQSLTSENAAEMERLKVEQQRAARALDEARRKNNDHRTIHR